jgi:vanillate O-demethylase monooxygenase subunit
MIGAPAPDAVAAYNAALAPYWHPVLAASELGSSPHYAELLGRPLVVSRLDGGLACFDDVCRHFGASLSLGEVIPAGLRCRYHGWTYDREGRCVDIPARRAAPIPREARVGAYGVEERYGLVWDSLAAGPGAAIPEFPEAADDRFRVTPLRTYPAWTASAPRIVMAALDDTHFPWVHPGLLGDRDHPEPPDHEVRREGDALVCSYSILQPANESIGGAALETVEYLNRVTPTTVRLTKRGPAGSYVLFQAMCPVAHNRSLVFLQTARDFDLEPARDQLYTDFEDVIQSQDRPVVESQRPWLLPPLASRLMLYVRPADLPLIAFQRWLEELGIPQV